MRLIAANVKCPRDPSQMQRPSHLTRRNVAYRKIRARSIVLDSLIVSFERVIPNASRHSNPKLFVIKLGLQTNFPLAGVTYNWQIGPGSHVNNNKENKTVIYIPRRNSHRDQISHLTKTTGTSSNSDSHLTWA